MPKVLKFTQHSEGVWEYEEEDAGVYEPWGGYTRHRARSQASSDSAAGRLRAALARASAVREYPLQTDASGAWGRIDEEINFPLEREQAPAFSFRWEYEGAPAVPAEHWQYFDEIEPASFSEATFERARLSPAEITRVRNIF